MNKYKLSRRKFLFGASATMLVKSSIVPVYASTKGKATRTVNLFIDPEQFDNEARQNNFTPEQTDDFFESICAQFAGFYRQYGLDLAFNIQKDIFPQERENPEDIMWFHTTPRTLLENYEQNPEAFVRIVAGGDYLSDKNFVGRRKKAIQQLRERLDNVKDQFVVVDYRDERLEVLLKKVYEHNKGAHPDKKEQWFREAIQLYYGLLIGSHFFGPLIIMPKFGWAEYRRKNIFTYHIPPEINMFPEMRDSENRKRWYTHYAAHELGHVLLDPHREKVHTEAEKDGRVYLMRKTNRLNNLLKKDWHFSEWELNKIKEFG